VATAKPAVDPLLDGLKRAIDALPSLLPLIGTKGKALFVKAQAATVERAVADGYLMTREVTAAAKGKKAASTVYGVITEAGARKLAETGGAQDVKPVLEALRGAVEKLGHTAARHDATEIRKAIESATATCVTTINAAFGGLREEVMTAFSGGGQSATDEIVAFVTNWAREKTVGPPFDEIMKYLKGRHPNLTVGAFHDALRGLANATPPRLRLSGWSKTIHELPDPELALFVKHTVTYYAHPTH
jgi:hypothetical protein